LLSIPLFQSFDEPIRSNIHDPAFAHPASPAGQRSDGIFAPP